MSIEFAAIMQPVAHLLLGEPNRALSSQTELRYGKRGSLSIDLTKGTWFDNEAGEGGGLLDLITRETRIEGPERFEWLRANGFEVGEGKPNGKHESKLGRIVATYDYTDEAGVLLFQVCRFDPKDFRQRRPDGKGGWIWGVKGVRVVPYRLPDLIEHADHPIFIVEGEKDCDRLWKQKIPATTNAGGAGKWRPELNQFFSGADVIIVPDRDPQTKNPKTGELMFHPDGRPMLPGQDHAQAIARHLHSVAARVRVLELWQHWLAMPLKGDVSDWLDAGHDAGELHALVDQTPDWTPTEAPPPPGFPRILTKREFIARFTPPDYLVDGIFQRRFIYALTGATGHAKSAIALLLSELISSPDPATLGRHRVEKGRVAYFVGENPDDICMRVIGADSQRSDPEAAKDDNILFIPGVFDIAGMAGELHNQINKWRALDLVIIDTSAAYFLGNEEMSNTQMGNHARMLRRLTELPGGPCVLVLCHPIKHAAEPAHLLPRGGGAFLAEMDGNLTAWKKADRLIELHHTKMRGPGFEPMTFELRNITTTNLVDAKGRMLPTVRAVLITQEQEDREIKFAASDEDKVLIAIYANSNASFATIADQYGWRNEAGEVMKSRVQRAVQRIVDTSKPGLLKKNRHRWELTEAGRTFAREAQEKLEAKSTTADTQQESLPLGDDDE